MIPCAMLEPDLVISRHRIICDLTTLDLTCIAAPPIWLALSEPHDLHEGICIRMSNMFQHESKASRLRITVPYNRYTNLANEYNFDSDTSFNILLLRQVI